VTKAQNTVDPQPKRLSCSKGPGDGRRRGRRVLLVGLLVLVGLVAAGAGYVAGLPSVGDAQARVAAILAAHHSAASTGPLPSKLATAVVATEDEHFYDNVIYDVAAGMARATVALLAGSHDPAGSTIAQQLAKQLYGQGTGLLATVREIGLGIKLALRYPRQHLLAMYLNVNYYGNGDWGDKAAAAGYFGTTPAQLTWAQASLLAGLLQAPSAYDPLSHFTLAKQRQREVLDQLVANHDLSRTQATIVYRQTLALSGRAQHHDQPAPTKEADNDAPA
jgi:penicillin-binding protein 1A